MKYSAGIVITYKKQILLAHVTNTKIWDIPKGEKEENEKFFRTMIRETFEETNIDLLPFSKKIKNLGKFYYTNNKTLFLYRLELDKKIDIKKLKCNSVFLEGEKSLPEMDQFKFVGFMDIYKYCNRNTSLVLNKMLNIELSKEQIEEINRIFTYILRHKIPKDLQKYGGWLDLDLFFKMLYENSIVFKNMSKKEIIQYIKSDKKNRYLIKDNKIKVLYGHSFDIKEKKEIYIPKEKLYHLTFDCFICKILDEGLKSMTRNFVFLGKNKEKALEYKKKITNKNFMKKYNNPKPVLLIIDAKKASDEGVVFYKENNNIICSKYISPKYISFEKEEEEDILTNKIFNFYKRNSQ